MKKRKPLRTADATYMHLNKTENFQKFFRGFMELLKRKLQRVDVDGAEPYYICGQIHQRFNRDWKPFRHLWNYTSKKRLDFYAAKDLIEERIGRDLICECQVMHDEKAVRRMQLKEFGVDFGEPTSSKKAVDVVSGWELTKIDRGLF
jgi:hypothetical protein